MKALALQLLEALSLLKQQDLALIHNIVPCTLLLFLKFLSTPQTLGTGLCSDPGFHRFDVGCTSCCSASVECNSGRDAAGIRHGKVSQFTKSGAHMCEHGVYMLHSGSILWTMLTVRMYACEGHAVNASSARNVFMHS